jgi:hypothetical protein
LVVEVLVSHLVLAIAAHHLLLLVAQLHHRLRHPVLFLLVAVLGLVEVLAQQAMAVLAVVVAGILPVALEIHQVQVHLKEVTAGLEILGT